MLRQASCSVLVLFPCCVILEAAGSLWIIRGNYLCLLLAWYMAVCVMNIADHNISWMCVDSCSQEKGWCVYFDFYIYDAEIYLHWGWLTGLTAVLTFVFEVAEFLVMKSLRLFDCFLCSICCKCHKLAMVKLPFFSHSPRFTLCPCEVLCSQIPCTTGVCSQAPWTVIQSSSQEFFSSYYGQFI